MIKSKVPHLDKRSRFSASQRFLLLFVTILQIIGIITVPVGVWNLTRLQVSGCSLFSPYQTLGKLLLASGILSILLCCSGVVIILKFYGSKHHNVEFSRFVPFFCVIVMLQVLAGILATVNDSYDKNEELKEGLRNIFHSNQSMECTSNIQKNFECCGYTNYTSWIQNSETMLKSCECNDGDAICQHLVINSTSHYIYSSPCLSKLILEVSSQNLFIRIYCAFISVSEVTMFFFVACMLYRLSGPAVVETKKIDSALKMKTSFDTFQVRTYI